MGLFLRFFFRPYPRCRGADVADNGLPALGDMNVLDGHLLLALRSIVLERLDLHSERAPRPLAARRIGVSTAKSSVRSGASSRREQPSLPTLAGFEFVAEDVASHDGSLSTFR
jgi:hypothetical protein